MIKNTQIPAQSKRLYCTHFVSVKNEEWICNTCLHALRDGKVPKLSVANGMEWPEKLVELNLHHSLPAITPKITFDGIFC